MSAAPERPARGQLVPCVGGVLHGLDATWDGLSSFEVGPDATGWVTYYAIENNGPEFRFRVSGGRRGA